MHTRLISTHTVLALNSFLYYIAKRTQNFNKNVQFPSYTPVDVAIHYLLFKITFYRLIQPFEPIGFKFQQLMLLDLNDRNSLMTTQRTHLRFLNNHRLPPHRYLRYKTNVFLPPLCTLSLFPQLVSGNPRSHSTHQSQSLHVETVYRMSYNRLH